VASTAPSHPIPSREVGPGSDESEVSPRRDPNRLAVVHEPGEEPSATIARAALHPAVRAASTLQKYSNASDTLELGGLVESLTEQTCASGEGDLRRGEAMLTAQAHTLDAIFNYLAQCAASTESARGFDRYLKLGLRA